MKTSTIVHVSVVNRIAVVTYGGVSRMFRLKQIDPLELIALYKSRGYKYSWLNADTALLTKKTAAAENALVAA